MMRLVAPVLLVAVVGLLAPPVVTPAQSVATSAQHEADRASAKTKGTQAQGEVRERWGKLTDDDIEELDGRREVGDFEARKP